MNRKYDPNLNDHSNDASMTRKLLDEGIEHSKAGRFDEAMKCFNQILEHDPENVDALHLSGVVAANRKNFKDARTLIKQAIAINPHEALFHFNLGNALLDEGQIIDAIKSFNETLNLRPGDIDVLNKLTSACDKLYNKAIEHFHAAELDKAELACLEILDIRPGFAEAWHLLGMVAGELGDHLAAIKHIYRALTISPEDPRYYDSLGTIFGNQGRHEYASECFKRAIRLKSDFLNAHIHLVTALTTLGKLKEAIDSARKIIELDPTNVKAYIVLASALLKNSKLDEALKIARHAVKLAPNNALALNTLARVLRALGQINEAIDTCQRSIQIDNCKADSHNILGCALKDIGRIEDAIVSFRRALDLDPSRADIHSNVLFSLHYTEPLNAKVIFQEHIHWAQYHTSTAVNTRSFKISSTDANRRLRIGYVSGDLRTHSVSYFFEPLLAAHDSNMLEVICFSNNPNNDDTTMRIRHHTDGWYDIRGLDDEQATTLIQSNAIDILVDLSGHTGHNRIPLFARKPAPIQITYLGYPDTTGIDEMDYRFTDEWADPPGQTDQYYTEQLIRLPNGFLCYQPPSICPEISPSPMRKNDYVTFGSFNNFAKVSPTIIRHWISILKKVSNSKLLLKSRGLEDGDKRIIKEFETHGIDPKRIKLYNKLPSTLDHLSLYKELDVALDTFPYNGTATTCEALWMGVPVITLAGPLHLSRVGTSLLHSAKLSELIAESPEEYIQKAIELAANEERLIELRKSLRKCMKASPLTDAKRIASSIETEYRQMWQKFCSSGD